MRALVLIGLCGFAAAACTPATTAGTAVGATAGAIVGGPVGAVVGAGVGATTGVVAGSAAGANAGGQLVSAGPGRCYVTDSAGNIITRRNGRPVVQSC
jgi:hypothetical protein